MNRRRRGRARRDGRRELRRARRTWPLRDGLALTHEARQHVDHRVALERPRLAPRALQRRRAHLADLSDRDSGPGRRRSRRRASAPGASASRSISSPSPRRSVSPSTSAARASIASPAEARSGAGRRPWSSGGVTTPRCTSASCQIPIAWLTITSATGVAASRSCSSRTASSSSGGRGRFAARIGSEVGKIVRPAPGVRGARRSQVSKVRSRSTILPRRQSREVGRYPIRQGFGGVPTRLARPHGRVHVGSVVRSRTTFGATVDASRSSAVAFARAAQRHEVMPHWPQTTPASTIAFALARFASSAPTARSWE